MTTDQIHALDKECKKVISKGFMSADNKNLLTFAALTSLFIISSATSFKIGYDIKGRSDTDNFNSLREYRQLEASIISDYEITHGIASIHAVDTITTPYSFIDSNGNIKQITVPSPK
jgi:hypothetical protein